MRHLWKRDKDGFLVSEDMGQYHSGPYCLRCEGVFCESCEKHLLTGNPSCKPRTGLTDYEEELEELAEILADRVDKVSLERAEAHTLWKDAQADHNAVVQRLAYVRLEMHRDRVKVRKLELAVAELEHQLAAAQLPEEDSDGKVA